MKTALHTRLTGLVAATATISALALTACGPESLPEIEREGAAPSVESMPERDLQRKPPVPTLQPAPPVLARTQATAVA